jgi:hypothetical protein
VVDHSIIQAPPFVIVACIRPVTPPGIIMGVLVKMPEAVDETIVDKAFDPLPFNR